MCNIYIIFMNNLIIHNLFLNKNINNIVFVY